MFASCQRLHLMLTSEVCVLLLQLPPLDWGFGCARVRGGMLSQPPPNPPSATPALLLGPTTHQRNCWPAGFLSIVQTQFALALIGTYVSKAQFHFLGTKTSLPLNNLGTLQHQRRCWLRTSPQSTFGWFLHIVCEVHRSQVHKSCQQNDIWHLFPLDGDFKWGWMHPIQWILWECWPDHADHLVLAWRQDLLCFGKVLFFLLQIFSRDIRSGNSLARRNLSHENIG